MTKKALRKEYLAKRIALQEEERPQLHEKMLTQFSKIKFPQVLFMMSYMAIPAKGEIVPSAFENVVQQEHAGCRICYPKTDFDTCMMEAIAPDEGIVMTNNEWGLREPENGEVINPQQIDMLLVPLLIFDKRGYRAGYGKGFYDRFIGRCRPDVITVGLCYFEPVEIITDVQVYDVPLQFCVTPEQVYSF